MIVMPKCCLRQRVIEMPHHDCNAKSCAFGADNTDVKILAVLEGLFLLLSTPPGGISRSFIILCFFVCRDEWAGSQKPSPADHTGSM